MTLVLDAGALLAVERGDRDVVALIAAERRAGRVPVTHGGVVGQAWRGGALLAIARAGDVIDDAVVLLAADGDDILTSDPEDLTALAVASDTHVELITV